MALAFLELLETRDDRVLFEADTGTSEYHRFAVGLGGAETEGYPALQGIRYRSPLARRAGVNPLRTTFELEVPTRVLDQDARFVQLTSYRGPDERAPAWSRVIEVWPPLGPLTTGRGFAMTADKLVNGTASAPCRNVSRSLTENRLSKQMFWEELLGVARLLVPLGSRLLADEAPASQPGKPSVQTGDIDELLKTILKLVGEAGRPTGAMAEAAPVAKQQSLRLGGGRTATLRPLEARVLRSGRSGGRLSRAADLGLLSGPALAALAPTLTRAIGPLLQKAPELLGTFADSPLRLFTAIAEADRKERELTNQQVQNMLAQGNQALMLHLLSLAGAGGAGSSGASQGLSGASSVRREPVSARGADDLFAPRLIAPPTIRVGGKPRAAYRRDGPITLQLVVEARNRPPDETPARAIAHLRIVDALDGALRLEKRFPLSDVRVGDTVPLKLAGDEVAKLPAGVDLLASVELRWRDGKGRTSTAHGRAVQGLYLAGEYLLGSLGERLHDDQSLRDPVRFRSFWHRIWEGGSDDHRRWRLRTTARYYYTVRPGESRNGRIDTRFRADETEDGKSRVEWRGRLKAGMELAVGELARLGPLFERATPWNEGELEALDGDDFRAYVEQQATSAVELRGRRSERGALWTFPVVDLVAVELLHVIGHGLDGEVTVTENVQKTFPVPVAACFVGLERES